MTTHPSSLSTFAMSAGDEPEPTVRTVAGEKSEPSVCTAAVIVHTIHYVDRYEGDPLNAGWLTPGSHDRAVEVRRQMNPFRFGVYGRFPASRGGDRRNARYRERRSGSGVIVRW